MKEVHVYKLDKYAEYKETYRLHNIMDIIPCPRVRFQKHPNIGGLSVILTILGGSLVIYPY